jgi:tetratricopeptide (TPR) repeat protein
MDEFLNNQSVAEAPQKGSMMNKVSFWLLLVSTVLLPIFFVPVSFISIQFGTSLLFSFGAILSTILYIVTGITTGSLDLPKPSKYTLGFLSVVPLMYLLAGVSKGFSRMSFFGYTFDISTVGFILLAFVYLFIVSILFREKNKISLAYKAFGISSALFTAFVVLRIATQGKILSFGVFSNVTTTMLGSWNNIAVLFAMLTVISILSLEILSVSKTKKILSYVSILVSLFFMALVNFSSLWLVVAIVSFLIVLYKMFYTENETAFSTLTWGERIKRVSAVPAIVMVLAVVFYFGANSFGLFLASKLKTESVEIRPSFMTTMEIARNTLRTSPVFGSGPNTFIKEWSSYKPNDIVSTAFWNTDFPNGVGLLPTFLVTTGVMGTLSWLVFLGFLVYLGFKSIFVKTEDSESRYYIVTSFFTALLLWIVNFVYVPSTAIFVLSFFFTGLFFASIYSAGIIPVASKRFNVNPRIGFVSSLIMVTSLVGVVSLGYGLFKNSLSLWYFQKSSYALNTANDTKLSEEYMLKAIVTVPNDVYYRSLSEIQLVKLNEVLAQDPAKVKQEDVQKQFSDGLLAAITSGVSAKDRDPSNYLNWVSLGRIYDAVSVPQLNITGSYESAQIAYIEALRLNPKNPGILMLLARMAVNRNDLNQARNYVQQAIQIKNNYLDAYFLLSQIEVASNNIREAIQSVTAASIIDPTNPAIMFQLGLLKYNVRDFDGAIDALEKAITMTPDYANAKFFLGLSYEATKQTEKAIKQFEDLSVSNPDSQEVKQILENLKSGKAIFTDATNTKPEKGGSLPLKENQ